MSVLVRNIVMCNMTGSATRFTERVQGRSLLSKVRVNGAWAQMSTPLLNVSFVG